MAIRRAAHAVYDTKHHVVWAPKYRKWIERKYIRLRVREIFLEIAEHHGFETKLAGQMMERHLQFVESEWREEIGRRRMKRR